LVTAGLSNGAIPILPQLSSSTTCRPVMAHTYTPHYQTASTEVERYPHTDGYSRSRSNPTHKRGEAKGRSHTYIWVEEQENLSRGRRGLPIKTEEWVKEQQTMLKASATETFYHMPRARTTSSIRRQEWEELIYVYEVEAEQWMKHEERARRVAHEREKTRLRIQEELRRIDARYQQQREAERCAQEESRRREQSETRRDRAKLMVEAWERYESCWSSLPTTTEELDFKTVPWPLVLPPKSTDEITQEAVVTFLYSHHHSQDQSRKERIRNAQLRWHPDRFRRFLGRVSETDRATVEDGVGIVARVLNELTEKEKKKSS
jgi:hypothetical protein